MKRFFIFILIFTHLFSTVGFSMEVHECGGKKEYSFYGFHLHGSCSCNHDDEKHSKDCCKDKKTQIKSVKKECQLSKVIIAKTASDLLFAPAFLLPNRIDIEETITTSIRCVEHPPNYSPPLYILYSVYRI